MTEADGDPQGYDADHPDIDLLRLRNYTIGRSLSEDEVVGTGGLDRVSELLGFLKPFVSLENVSPTSTMARNKVKVGTGTHISRVPL